LPNTAAEESDPAGVILFVMDGPYRLPFPNRTGCPDRSCQVACWWNFQLLLNSKCTQPSVMRYVTQGRHVLVLCAFSLVCSLYMHMQMFVSNHDCEGNTGTVISVEASGDLLEMTELLELSELPKLLVLDNTQITAVFPDKQLPAAGIYRLS
jgi:hypothetical protein